jgi:hemerythrin-like domain-containing protein
MSSSNPSTWADGPFPLIPTPFGARDVSKEHGSKFLAQQMAHIHNCILRVLNAVYNQAPYVKTEKGIVAFLQLVRLWHNELEHHHQTEEICLFPRIEQLTGEKNVMEGNVEQHHQFEPGLKALHKYATETSVKDYNAEDLRKILKGFGDILQTHLNDEINTLLSLEKYDSNKLKKAWNETHKYVLKTCDEVS